MLSYVEAVDFSSANAIVAYAEWGLPSLCSANAVFLWGAIRFLLAIGTSPTMIAKLDKAFCFVYLGHRLSFPWCGLLYLASGSQFDYRGIAPFVVLAMKPFQVNFPHQTEFPDDPNFQRRSFVAQSDFSGQ
jgi:hypothetical protein